MNSAGHCKLAHVIAWYVAIQFRACLFDSDDGVCDQTLQTCFHRLKHAIDWVGALVCIFSVMWQLPHLNSFWLFAS